VPSGVAEDLAEHIARAVDDTGLTGELRHGRHEPGDLDDAREPIDVAHDGRRRRDRVERALARQVGVGCRDQPVSLADLACGRQRAETIGNWPEV
jgi:hypothetical protein